jgi:hypothetical protein
MMHNKSTLILVFFLILIKKDTRKKSELTQVNLLNLSHVNGRRSWDSHEIEGGECVSWKIGSRNLIIKGN